MTLSGKITRAPVSGGIVLLETADGKRYALEGITDFNEGELVTVKGHVKPPEESVGIGMTGDPIFYVAMRGAPDPSSL